MAAYRPGNIAPQSGKSKKAGRISGLLDTLRLKSNRRATTTHRPMADLQRGLQAKRFTRGLVSMLMLLGIGGLIFRLVLSMLVNSDVFRLTDIKVRGNSKVETSRIVMKGGLEQGKSLLAMDVGHAEREISSLPWIDRVTVVKKWPSAVEVKIREQQPLALVNVDTGNGNELFYLNTKGKLVVPLEAGEDFDFPVITGAEKSSFAESGGIAEGDQVEPAFRLLKLAARGNAILPIQAISEVHIDGERGVIVYLVDQPFPIYFGRDKMYTKYYRLVKILERLYRKKRMEGITAIRMDYTESKVLVARADIDR